MKELITSISRTLRSTKHEIRKKSPRFPQIGCLAWERGNEERTRKRGPSPQLGQQATNTTAAIQTAAHFLYEIAQPHTVGSQGLVLAQILVICVPSVRREFSFEGMTALSVSLIMVSTHCTLQSFKCFLKSPIFRKVQVFRSRWPSKVTKPTNGTRQTNSSEERPRREAKCR